MSWEDIVKNDDYSEDKLEEKFKKDEARMLSRIELVRNILKNIKKIERELHFGVDSERQEISLQNKVRNDLDKAIEILEQVWMGKY